jgi:hypothetical protein
MDIFIKFSCGISVLLDIQRKATLRHDDATQVIFSLVRKTFKLFIHTNQATVLNLLLRSYVEFSLYEQADKLISKSVFPDTADNNQTARYMYYQGVFFVLEWLFPRRRRETHCEK